MAKKMEASNDRLEAGSIRFLENQELEKPKENKENGTDRRKKEKGKDDNTGKSDSF